MFVLAVNFMSLQDFMEDFGCHAAFLVNGHGSVSLMVILISVMAVFIVPVN